MIAPECMVRLITRHANLVEEVGDLRRQHVLRLQPSHQIVLRFFRHIQQTDMGSQRLCQQFGKLAQFE